MQRVHVLTMIYQRIIPSMPDELTFMDPVSSQSSIQLISLLATLVTVYYQIMQLPASITAIIFKICFV